MTHNPLLVDGGETAAISKSVLQIEDPDNAQDVLVMVLAPPQHGQLTRLHGDRALTQFKLEELSREQLQYVHDGSEGEQDGMLLQVNDGHSYQNILLQVNIAHKVGWTISLFKNNTGLDSQQFLTHLLNPNPYLNPNCNLNQFLTLTVISNC